MQENGATDYTRFPDPKRQKSFCVEYVKTARRLESMRSDISDSSDAEDEGNKNNNGEEDLSEEANELLNEVHKFILVNHLYWGLWAVNQAAEEGCEEFDYINYATNRFNEFYTKKDEWEEK